MKRIQVEVRGGCIQQVVFDGDIPEDIELVVIDYDETESKDENGFSCSIARYRNTHPDSGSPAP